MRTEIEASSTLLATHHWPAAPAARAYLRHPHAHIFKVTVWAEVDHTDRQIEFHDLRQRLENALQYVGELRYEEHGILPYAGSMSCEDLGQRLLKALPEVHRVRVMEDEFVGATVRRASEAERTVEGGFFKVWTTQPSIVTLCGSTRFKDEFRSAEARFETEGVCVFTVGFFAHADGIAISEEGKVAADELHKWKILMSDFIYVVNPGGYIGDSTRSEIEFARKHGIEVRSLEALSI